MNAIRVTAGNPTADELAIVVALLTTPESAVRRPPAQLWSVPQLRPNELPRSWRASGLPR